MPPEDYLFIDDDIVVINKPAELLSVPGRGPDKLDSASSRLTEQLGEIHVVHRLDMSTSGVMIFARNKEALKHLQQQFQHRKTQKTYQAIIHGLLKPGKGAINLPMRCDWPNRPRQMVCYEHGKKSLTRWNTLEQLFINEQPATRVELIPVTGRSHQLRIHCLSLGHPILGDNLYATGEALACSPRLLLHAEKLTLQHPTTLLEFTFTAPVPF